MVSRPDCLVPLQCPAWVSLFLSDVSMDALLEIDIRMLDDDENPVFVHGPPASVRASAATQRANCGVRRTEVWSLGSETSVVESSTQNEMVTSIAANVGPWLQPTP